MYMCNIFYYIEFVNTHTQMCLMGFLPSTSNGCLYSCILDFKPSHLIPPQILK